MIHRLTKNQEGIVTTLCGARPTPAYRSGLYRGYVCATTRWENVTCPKCWKLKGKVDGRRVWGIGSK